MFTGCGVEVPSTFLASLERIRCKHIRLNDKKQELPLDLCGNYFSLFGV